MKQLVDIEVFYQHFEISLENYKTHEKIDFQVNQFRDDRIAAKQYLRDYNGFMIHFNGIKYDFAVLAYIDRNNWFLNKSVLEFCRLVKEFSDQLINLQDELFVYKYIGHFTKITHIDLFLYWAKLLRISKKISLKALGIQMNYPVVQELPYPPSIQELTYDQIQEIHHYCSVHDLGILRMLCDQMEGGKTTIPLGNLGSIQLRHKIVHEFGIPAWSMDAPKIASEALLNAYCKVTGKDKKSVSKMKFEAPTIRFGDLFKDIDFGFQTSLFQQVYNSWMNSVNTFSKEFAVINPSGDGIMVSCGVGGLHNLLSNKIYESDDDHILLDIDIESLYPVFIINYEAFGLPEVLTEYKKFKEYRVTQTKPMLKQYKGKPEEIEWRLIDAFYKVILNGVSGHLDSEHSWLFNRPGIMKVRCGGQLVLLTLIEQCQINDITLVQANTDGLTVRIHKDKVELFKSIVEACEKKFNVKFEYAEYKKMVFSSVNSYLAIETNGKIKEKGEFVRLPELGNSTDFLIIPHLLHDYFVLGIKPEVAIYNYTNIFLFCASQKVDKSYHVEWNNQILPQRLNRYYVSKKGAYLYKCRGGKKSHMLKGFGVQIYNSHIPQDMSRYNINYPFYLKQVNDMIWNLEGSTNQTKLL